MKTEDDNRPLTQEELKAWWPFERLDPKRFPVQTPAPDHFEDLGEALL